MNRLFRYSLAMCLVLLVAMALTAKAAEVPVFVLAGQSNAVGVNTLSELTPAQQTAQPNVLFYGPKHPSTAQGLSLLGHLRRLEAPALTERADPCQLSGEFPEPDGNFV
jgi:hypothetical protein